MSKIKIFSSKSSNFWFYCLVQLASWILGLAKYCLVDETRNMIEMTVSGDHNKIGEDSNITEKLVLEDLPTRISQRRPSDRKVNDIQTEGRRDTCRSKVAVSQRQFQSLVKSRATQSKGEKGWHKWAGCITQIASKLLKLSRRFTKLDYKRPRNDLTKEILGNDQEITRKRKTIPIAAGSTYSQVVKNVKQKMNPGGCGDKVCNVQATKKRGIRLKVLAKAKGNNLEFQREIEGKTNLAR